MLDSFFPTFGSEDFDIGNQSFEIIIIELDTE
jgi:hypothetical protein